jgi:hypothetical protein
MQDTKKSCADMTPSESLCGDRVGNRRVRIQRPQRGIGHKVVAVVRRSLSR